MTLLRPRTVAWFALFVATLACTCQPPSGGGGGGGAGGEEARVEPAPRGKGRGRKGGGGGAGGDEPDEVEMPPGVEDLGGGRWRVQRKVVDKYVEHPDKLGCSAREKGKGYELVGVQSQDDAYALGARNHDVVMTINGKSLDDQSDLINLYLTLQDADKLTVAFDRGGERQTHTYEIVD